jgi:DNA-binding XRE family transcriptional regulator
VHREQVMSSPQGMSFMPCWTPALMREFREKHDLSRAAVGRAVNRSGRTIAAWEIGQHACDCPDTLTALAATFASSQNVSLLELLYGPDYSDDMACWEGRCLTTADVEAMADGSVFRSMRYPVATGHVRPHCHTGAHDESYSSEEVWRALPHVGRNVYRLLEHIRLVQEAGRSQTDSAGGISCWFPYPPEGKRLQS